MSVNGNQAPVAPRRAVVAVYFRSAVRLSGVTHEKTTVGAKEFGASVQCDHDRCRVEIDDAARRVWLYYDTGKGFYQVGWTPFENVSSVSYGPMVIEKGKAA